jgi:hypothetical protein
VGGLPQSVAKYDRLLVRGGRQVGLSHLRWHWTLNRANPDVVAASEYAHAVEATVDQVVVDAQAYELWLEGKFPTVGAFYWRFGIGDEAGSAPRPSA